MAGAFGGMVQMYREHYKLSALEAVQRAADTSPGNVERILNAPPDAVTWLDLEALSQKDEAQALRRWEQIKQAARDELQSGHRAARAVEDGSGPWELARFAAVRTDLMETFRPRNGVERLLVDQLAQWQVLLWRWQEALTTWTTYASLGPRKAKKGESYETIRISESEALERAMQKVERLHRLYLRTLKALQDQRRLRRPILVRQAGQVNIAHQQVNVAGLCATGILDSAE